MLPLTANFLDTVPPSLYYIAIAALVLLVWLLLRVRARMRFRGLVYQLFGGSVPVVSAEAFWHASLDDPAHHLYHLPAPVKRYLRHVLPDGQPRIRFLRLRHEGSFRTNLKQGWLRIKGQQYFAVENPGFVWRGRTANFAAIDSYVNGAGGLQVWLFTVVRILNGSGPAYNQGELLRWLGECVWMPTAFVPTGLPDERLHWAAINDHSARLSLTHGGQTVSYTVFFNKENEIERLETERYMGADRLERWIGRVSHYELREGVLVPTKISAAWAIGGGEQPYAQFRITQFEYNQPALFG